MCGIAGLADYKSDSLDEPLRLMTTSISHRGPDAFGHRIFCGDNYKIGLGHQRLSIMDLSSRANQPMRYEHLNIVYNGEIYNYKDIRHELISFGYTFETESDTEVVLKSIHAFSDKAYKKFNGMFSIAVYDEKNSSITLVRDRLGIKPLYYSHATNLFLFASELKALLCHPRFHKKINQRAYWQYFRYGYIADNLSIYRDTYQVPPGSILTFDLTKDSLSINPFWNISDYSKPSTTKTEEKKHLQNIESLLFSACKLRTSCDVEFGAFLSGGYDSSLVCALTQKVLNKPLKTFTIGFEDSEYDESKQARKISEYLGTEHHEFRLSRKVALEYILKAPNIWDEPLVDESTVPIALLAHCTSKHVKVVLSADGGDELFWGYPKYKRVLSLDKIMRRIPGKLLLGETLRQLLSVQPMWSIKARINKFVQLLSSNNNAEILRELQQIFNDIELERLLLDKSGRNSKYSILTTNNCSNDIISNDIISYHTSNILVKVDRATMYSGIEARSPFLDYRIVEYMMGIHPNVNIKENTMKYLVKELAHKHIPQALLDRPKMGFAMPLMYWLKEELSPYISYFLDEKKLSRYGVYNVTYIKYLRVQYELGHLKDTRKLWAILVMEMWREKHGEKNNLTTNYDKQS